MGFDPVAWGVGGGALHGPELARVIAYAAASQSNGVMGVGDLKITQYGTPGAGVAMAPGVAFIRNRTSGYTYQSYAVRAPSQDTVGVVSTGASARVDLVVARVEDPWLPSTGWSNPADATVGPYAFLRVYSNVGAGSGTLPAPVTDRATALAFLAAQGHSAEPLALVSQPANNSGGVTNAMITDLRAAVLPRSDRQLRTANPGAISNLTQSSSVAPNWQDWAISVAIPIPDWATKMTVLGQVGGARLDRLSTSVAGTAYGSTRVRVGGTAAAPAATTQGVIYDLEATINDNARRQDLSIGDTIAVPSALRGTVQTFAIQGNKASGNKNLYVDAGSFAQIDVQFVEAPV